MGLMASIMRAPSPMPALSARSNQAVPDFSSDVGRKKFGFSHEEIDDSAAYYEGQFRLYQRCGDGTLHSPESGFKYVGQFQADQFHGDGDQTLSDGSKYSGQWKYGQKNGAGVYISIDRLKYVGQWENGRRHGHGTQEYLNGDRYEGWWFNGLCSGMGTYSFSDGSRYEGAWAGGRYDGAGMLYCSDGSRERQWHSSGLLMKREVLPPGTAPRKSTRHGVPANTAGQRNKILLGQSRDEMHKPTLLPKPQPSKYLMRRETAGRDLSAPPVRPKTAQTSQLPSTRPCSSALAQSGMSIFGDSEDTRPSTARGASAPSGQLAGKIEEMGFDTPFPNQTKKELDVYGGPSQVIEDAS